MWRHQAVKQNIKTHGSESRGQEEAVATRMNYLHLALLCMVTVCLRRGLRRGLRLQGTEENSPNIRKLVYLKPHLDACKIYSSTV